MPAELGGLIQIRPRGVYFRTQKSPPERALLLALRCLLPFYFLVAFFAGAFSGGQSRGGIGFDGVRGGRYVVDTSHRFYRGLQSLGEVVIGAHRGSGARCRSWVGARGVCRAWGGWVQPRFWARSS